MMSITKNLGMLLLAIYLLVGGVTALVPALAIPAVIPSLLAVLAGVLILINK